jgi:hypothetical protein
MCLQCTCSVYSESAIISLLTSRIGTVSWHLFQKSLQAEFECLCCLNIFCKMTNILQHLKSHNNCSKCGKEFSGRSASGNFKQHEKICQGPKKLNFCQYCAKQFKFNYLVIRHEKGCRDRPGWINIIVWIDSFFELQCCGTMSTISLHLLSWWISISFTSGI